MAREHPRYANTEFPDYEYREYPKTVFPGAKDPKKPYDAKGKPLKGIIVNSEAEEREAMGPEAPELVAASGGVSRLATEDDQRARLIEEAETLGIQFDKRWGVARIQDAIDTHKQSVI